MMMPELTLALFVTWVLADHPHNIIAADNLAGFAETFDGGSDFHEGIVSGPGEPIVSGE
jgi:hypothetical protein